MENTELICLGFEDVILEVQNGVDSLSETCDIMSHPTRGALGLPLGRRSTKQLVTKRIKAN